MQVMHALPLGASRAAKSEEARRVLEEASGRIAATAPRNWSAENRFASVVP
jgi:hypothetical protein